VVQVACEEPAVIVVFEIRKHLDGDSELRERGGLAVLSGHGQRVGNPDQMVVVLVEYPFVDSETLFDGY
jgi:hypothetical protein